MYFKIVMSNYINNILSSHRLRRQYIYLLNYYYIIEDSVKGTYRSTIEYWFPSEPNIETHDDFELVDIDDCQYEEPDKWFENSVFQSIKDSIYLPQKEHSMEELENYGYYPLSNNKQFSQHFWDCQISECDKCKYDILAQLMSHWKDSKVNIHIISGPYEEDSFYQYKEFANRLDHNFNIQNTYLHKFDRDNYLTFIESHNEQSKFKFKKREQDTIYLTILDNPEFELGHDDLSYVSGTNKHFIIFQHELTLPFNDVDYIVTPSSNIKELNTMMTDYQYPPLDDNSIYIVISHPLTREMKPQLNYIKL